MYVLYITVSILGEIITSVAVGLHHTVFGTKSGNIYCCGDSSQAQCGSLEKPHFNTPVCVASFNSPVKKVNMVYRVFILGKLMKQN